MESGEKDCLEKLEPLKSDSDGLFNLHKQIFRTIV